LPSVDDFQAAARRWGINDGDAVVVYDDWNSLAACRAWWLLRYMGVENVRVLDGALTAWTTAGHPLARCRHFPALPAPHPRQDHG
jgi:thiosulfate/3-mercaptopyruvate sulfurtransferase